MNVKVIKWTHGGDKGQSLWLSSAFGAVTCRPIRARFKVTVVRARYFFLLVAALVLVHILYLLFIPKSWVITDKHRVIDQETSQEVQDSQEVGDSGISDAPKVTQKPKVILRSNFSCYDLEVEIPPEPTYEFQKIASYPAYLYSAFLDSNSILLVGLRESYAPQNTLYCHLWYTNHTDSDVLTVTQGAFDDLPEDHGRRYTASYLKCPLPESIPPDSPPPAAVSVSTQKCEKPSNLFHVLVPPPPEDPQEFEFVVCVACLNREYSRAYELVEMIEFNKLLGAEKFVFYKYSTGENVDQVLEHYKQLGDVEVLPWHVPVKVNTWPFQEDPDVHYFGQLASHNDCLIRYRHRARWLVYTDLDEFIVPKENSTWAELVQSRESGNETSALQFQCVIFRKEWPTVPDDFEWKSTALKYNSVVLRHSTREENFHEQGQRSKCIVNPRATTVVGIHNLWTYSGTVDYVPPEVAAVHHYRLEVEPFGDKTTISDNSVLEKFGSQLVNRLEATWTRLSNVTMDIDTET